MDFFFELTAILEVNKHFQNFNNLFIMVSYLLGSYITIICYFYLNHFTYCN